jgi:hypothetical protein
MVITVTRVLYGLLGVLYVVIGAGAMLVPTGWLPESFSPDALVGETPSPFVGHLMQEFGTVVIAVGLVFLWRASRREFSRAFHWAMTVYFCLDSLIHWVGPDGPIGSGPRGITNSILPAMMLLLGILELGTSNRLQRSRTNVLP